MTLLYDTKLKVCFIFHNVYSVLYFPSDHNIALFYILPLIRHVTFLTNYL